VSSVDLPAERPTKFELVIDLKTASRVLMHQLMNDALINACPNDDLQLTAIGRRMCGVRRHLGIDLREVTIWYKADIT
jgi:hypothetical protein